MAHVQQVTPPPRKPRAGGIKSIVGDFIEEPRLAASTGIVWEGSDCLVQMSKTRAGCYDAIVPAEPKTSSGVSQYEGIAPAFAGYAGVECWIGGDADGESFAEQARRHLLEIEDRAVEEYLADWAEASSTSLTAASITAAIASLEEDADRYYVGQPVLLMTRDAAVYAYAASALVRENGQLVTPNGTPVIASAFNVDEKVSIIGWPAVYASPIVAGSAALTKKNLDLAIAERVYAVGVDCEYRATANVDPYP